MSTSLAMNIEARVNWNFQNLLDLSTPADQQAIRNALSLTNGTGSNQVNDLFADRRTLASGANDDLDLNGVLVNSFGVTLTFTKIKGIFIRNLGPTVTPPAAYVPTIGENLRLDSSVANSIVSVFGGSATSKLDIQSGGFIALGAPLDGYTVTAATADKLRITNVGTGSIDYDIIVFGLH